MSDNPTETPKKFPPSRFVIDSDGRKWRLCAGVAVLNSSNRLLVGERISVAGSWQCPQGGVDAADKDTGSKDETIDEAAARELYEEMGLVVGKHVVPDDVTNGNTTKTAAVRYETTGTNSWLTKNGFSGQELHWRIFRCIDGRGDNDASLITDLSGRNGEPVEFTQVKWDDVDHVVENVWEAKKKNYEVLQSTIISSVEKWNEKCISLDFEGRWSRQNNLGVGLVESLMARGMEEEKAKLEVTKPYIQTWARDEEEKSAWIVSTFGVDGTTVRRKLKYDVGTWEEEYKGQSTLFGPSTGTTVLTRRTFYVPEPDADGLGVAHVTVSQTPKGVEESRRYLKEDGRHMVLRRTFWSGGGGGEPAISTEVFVRE